LNKQVFFNKLIVFFDKIIYNNLWGDNMFKIECNFIPLNARKQHWTQARFSYLEHPRPDYGIMLVLNGQIDFVSPQMDTFCAKSGDIVFLPKNSYYEARFRIELGEIDNYLINFELDKDFNYAKPMLISENASFSSAELFRQFVDENYNVNNINFRSKGIFYLLLDSVLNTNKDPESSHNISFEKAKILLKESEDIPISKIARECSVSESGLRKIFSEKIGMSPTQFRLREKYKKAKFLLESTDMSVGEISDKLNFYDTAYFCRLFRKQTGMSPKQYRQNKRL